MRPKGFTFVEMLVAFAIVGVLALLATTIWQAQTVHRHVEAGVEASRPVLDAVASAFELLGEAPVDRVDADLSADPNDSASRYVQGVDVVSGRVDIHFGYRAHAAIAGRVLRLTPWRDADGGIVWRCEPPGSGSGLTPLVGGRGERTPRPPASPLLPRHRPAFCA